MFLLPNSLGTVFHPSIHPSLHAYVHMHVVTIEMRTYEKEHINKTLLFMLQPGLLSELLL